MSAGVRLQNVKKSFGAVEVIHDVSIEIPKGEFAVFVGPSGCGKSTLLRMIAGLEETTSGRIEIAGRDVTDAEPADRGVAMVFQNYALYPHLTVAQNMGFSLSLAGAKKSEIKEKVSEAARILQLSDHLDKRPSSLSGGQRQRVAIGRAIVREPDVFLFDEPLSNLDAELRVEMRRELAQLHRQIGATMIYVTHDQVEAMTLADDIFVLKDGYVQQSGAPLSLYDDPDNRFVGGFIGSPAMNFFEAEVTGTSNGRMDAKTKGAGHTFTAAIGQSVEIGRPVTLGIRPEHIDLTEGGLRAKVDMIEQLGGVSFLHAQLETGGNVVIERHQLRESIEGQTIGITAEPKNIMVFADDGRRLR